MYTAKVFQKAAPDLATSSNRPLPEEDDVTLDPLMAVPSDPINSKTVPATMHARHSIDVSSFAIGRWL